MLFEKLVVKALETRSKAGKKRNMKRYNEALEKVERWHFSKDPMISLSMLAKCERMIYFKLNKEKRQPIEPHKQIMMDMRSAIHSYFQCLLYEVYDFIDIEYPILDKKLKIIGKLDVVDTRTNHYHEIKTRNVFTFKKDKEAPDAKDYIQVQGALMSKKWKKGSLIYIDVNYFSPPVEHPVKADQDLHKKIKTKIKRVFKAFDEGKLPKKNTVDCAVCDYAYMCTKKKLVL